MATQCHAPPNPPLDTSAQAVQPLHTLQWTLLNDPLFNKVCKYHTHPIGNICLFGRGCKFAHLQELERPPLCEQLSSMHTLLTTLLNLLLPSAAPTAAAASVSTHTLNVNAQPFYPDLFLPFEQTLVATVTTNDLVYDFLDDTVDIDDTILGAFSQRNQTADSDEKKADDARDVNGVESQRNQTATTDEKQADDARDVNGVDYEPFIPELFREQWSYLLANDPDALHVLYPDAKGASSDAYLDGLKSEKWNQHPVIVQQRIKGSNRFSVLPFDYGKTTHRVLSIKETNIRALHPEPAQNALKRFKSNVKPEAWTLLTSGDAVLTRELWNAFIEQQLPYFDAETKTYAFLLSTRLDEFNSDYKSLINDTLKEIISQGLEMNDTDCAIAISLLYSPTWKIRHGKYENGREKLICIYRCHLEIDVD